MPRMARRGPGPGPGPGPRRGPARPPARRAVGRSVRQKQRRRRRRRVLVGGAVVVGTGAMAYKLSQSQTKQVEEASGTPIEEMTDEEIAEYVQKYNIQTEQLNEDDQAALAETSDEEPDYMDELEKLADLHSKGILTDEEFEAKKAQILGI